MNAKLQAAFDRLRAEKSTSLVVTGAMPALSVSQALKAERSGLYDVIASGKAPAFHKSRIKPTPSVRRDTESRYDPAVDVDALVQKLIDHNFDSAMFESIDAKLDMPRCPNIFTWLTDRQFAGQPVDIFSPWPKQIFVLSSVREDVCPTPTCTDRRFFETMFDCTLDEIRDRVTFFEYGVCPRCKGKRIEFQSAGLLHGIEEMVLCLGQRASKTSMAAGFLGCHEMHMGLTTPNPPAYFRLKPNQRLYGTFVAQTKEQAVLNPWQDFTKFFDSCNWFREYNARLGEIADREGWDVHPYKRRETLLEYRHKNLYMGCHGPNKRTLRGATRFFAGVDEFGWFKDDEGLESANATETEDALANALFTVRSRVRRLREAGVNDIPLVGLLAKTSSPAHVNDPIMRSVANGRRSTKVFVCHAATWEFNPNIRREDLKDEFAKRPAEAERSFGANPPMAQTPFHKNPAIFETLPKSFDNVLPYSVEVFQDALGVRYVVPKLKSILMDTRIPCVVSVDAGETNNGFGITLDYLEPDGSPVCAGVISVEPELSSENDLLTINMEHIFTHTLLPIVEKCLVVAVVYDRWQSSAHVNRLNDHAPFATRVKAIRAANPRLVEGRDKIPTIGGAVKQTLRYVDFLEMDSVLSRLKMPKLERPFASIKLDVDAALARSPALTLLYQIATVRDTGAKVTKPARGNDDLYRSMVNGITYMLHPDRRPIFTDHSGARLHHQKSGRSPMIVVTRSGAMSASGHSPAMTGFGAIRLSGSARST